VRVVLGVVSDSHVLRMVDSRVVPGRGSIVSVLPGSSSDILCHRIRLGLLTFAVSVDSCSGVT
jgi:hypothetical protein